MIQSYFRIICDRCGVHFLATPHPEFGEMKLPENTATIATVDHCAFCIMQRREVSHRTLFLCRVVKELEELKERDQSNVYQLKEHECPAMFLRVGDTFPGFDDSPWERCVCGNIRKVRLLPQEPI